MRIFTVGEDTQAGAQALSSRDWDNKQNTVVDFATVPSNALTSPADSLVFLGHGNTEEFGGYSPKDFVRSLNRVVPENRRNRINHIYLIGCEIGKQTVQGCVAQRITDELGKNGYANVVVHAIASPNLMPKEEEWYVNITTRLGVGRGFSFINPPKVGDIKAVKLNKVHARRCDELRQVIDNDRLPAHAKLEAQRELDVILDEEKLVIHTCDPKTELDKPWHTFRPGENYQQRLARLNRNPVVQQYQQEQADRDRAITVIRAQIEHLRAKDHKNKDKRVSMLEDLVNTLLKTNASQWKSKVKEILPGLEVDSRNVTGILTDQFVSTTYKLMEDLSKGKFPEERSVKHTERKDKHPKEEKAKQHADEPYSSGTESSGSENSSRSSSPRSDTGSDVEPLMEKAFVGNKQNLDEARRQLKEQRKRLKHEIRDRWCFSFFYPSTKEHKMLEIKNLLAHDDDRSFSRALETARTNKVLTAGYFGSRTKNLLENIAKGDAARGIEEPLTPAQIKKGM